MCSCCVLFYRLNVTYFKIPQSDGISPRLNLHVPLKKLFLNWMLLEKNNEEVKKPEQKCLVLFFHNKNKKEQNISFSCAFFPQQKTEKRWEISWFNGPCLEPNLTFSKLWKILAQTSKALSKAVLGLWDLKLSLHTHFTIILLNHRAFCSPSTFA